MEMFGNQTEGVAVPHGDGAKGRWIVRGGWRILRSINFNSITYFKNMDSI